MTFLPQFAVLCIALSLACAKHDDPTMILAPSANAAAPSPTPLPTPVSGAQLRLQIQGDAFNAPVIHVWVEDNAGNSLLTLDTTNGASTYSCPSANFCPCEGGAGHWVAYCAANPNDFTDAKSHPTVLYSSSTQLTYNWDWKDRTATLVPDGTYYFKAEISGYLYGSPQEAAVNLTKNTTAGSATGTLGGRWLSASATWNP